MWLGMLFSALFTAHMQSRKRYERGSEEAETAMHKLERADNDPNSTKAKIDQLTTSLRQKNQTAEDYQNNYVLQLERTNVFRNKHFNTSMPALYTVRKGRMNLHVYTSLPYSRVLCEHVLVNLLFMFHGMCFANTVCTRVNILLYFVNAGHNIKLKLAVWQCVLCSSYPWFCTRGEGHVFPGCGFLLDTGLSFAMLSQCPY